TGTGGITKNGPGLLTLGSFFPSDYTGRTTVAQGELRVTAGTSLGATGAANDTVVNAGAVLTAAVAGFAETLTLSGTGIGAKGALQGESGGWSGRVTLNTADTEISVPAGDTFTISGVIQGAGGLIKRQTGTLRLSGAAANTYAGATNVTAGILELNKSFGVNAVPGTLIVGQASGGLNSDVVRSLNGGQIPNNAAITVNLSGR